MPAAAVSPLRTYRLLSAALMAAPIVIGIALAFVISSPRRDRAGNPVATHSPGPWLYIAIIVLGLVMAVLAQTVGYRVPAIPTDVGPGQARELALRAYQQSMFLRFALSESVAIVGIALLFTDQSNTILPYIVAAAIAELLMAYHMWPSGNLIRRVQQRLDRGGGRSELSDALGEIT